MSNCRPAPPLECGCCTVIEPDPDPHMDGWFLARIQFCAAHLEVRCCEKCPLGSQVCADCRAEALAYSEEFG